MPKCTPLNACSVDFGLVRSTPKPIISGAWWKQSLDLGGIAPCHDLSPGDPRPHHSPWLKPPFGTSRDPWLFDPMLFIRSPTHYAQNKILFWKLLHFSIFWLLAKVVIFWLTLHLVFTLWELTKINKFALNVFLFTFEKIIFCRFEASELMVNLVKKTLQY